ncbi:hypothetical protein HDU81_005695 [Chytriomyces hyalinus]|nr:hypothetical protein HDU81_005695 [Chytriomyces hyalinus]
MIAANIQRRFGRYPTPTERPTCDTVNTPDVIETTSEEVVAAVTPLDTSIPERTSKTASEANADEVVQQVDAVVQDAAQVSKPLPRLKIDRSRIRSAAVAPAANGDVISVPDDVSRPNSLTVHIVDGDETVSTPARAGTSATKFESVVPPVTPTKVGTISKQADRGPNSKRTNAIKNNKLGPPVVENTLNSMTNLRNPLTQKAGEPRDFEPTFRKIDGPRRNQTYTAPSPRNVQSTLNVQSRFFASAQKISRPMDPITKSRVEPWALALFSHILELFDLNLAGSVTLISKLTSAFQADRYIQIRNANVAAIRTVPEGDVKAKNNEYTKLAHSEPIPIHRERSLDEKLTKDETALLKEFMSLIGSFKSGAAIEDVTETIEFQPALPLALAAILGIDPMHILDCWAKWGGNQYAHAERIVEAVARGNICAADYADHGDANYKRWAHFDRLWGAGDGTDEEAIPVWLPKGTGGTAIPERKYIKECIATTSTRSTLSKTIPSHPVLEPGCTGCNSGSCCGTIDGCTCLGLVGGFAYNHDALRDRVVSHVIECGDACGCNSSCTNRYVERWTATEGGDWKFSKLLAGLVVKATRRKGWGLFTTRDINHGSFIGEYVGTILTPQGIAVRTAMNAASTTEDKNTSVLVVRERTVFNNEALRSESFGLVANVYNAIVTIDFLGFIS